MVLNIACFGELGFGNASCAVVVCTDTTQDKDAHEQRDRQTRWDEGHPLVRFASCPEPQFRHRLGRRSESPDQAFHRPFNENRIHHHAFCFVTYRRQNIVPWACFPRLPCMVAWSVAWGGLPLVCTSHAVTLPSSTTNCYAFPCSHINSFVPFV